MRLAALALAGFLVGCGSTEPRFDRADVQPIVALTSRIAHEGACAQARDVAALKTRALRLVNEGRVPAELQEPFLSGVNALGEQMPACVPTVKPEPASPPEGRGKGHDRGKGHKKHGKGD